MEEELSIKDIECIEEKAAVWISRFMAITIPGIFAAAEAVCPRCGHYRPMDKFSKHAVSYYINQIICDDCQADENVREVAHLAPIPLDKWGILQGLSEMPIERSDG